jgi:hypothetical protein
MKATTQVHLLTGEKLRNTIKNMHKRQKDLTNTSEKATITEMSALRVPGGRAVKTYGNAPAHI